MPGFIFVAGNVAEQIAESDLTRVLDPLGNAEVGTIRGSKYLLSCSSRPNSPCSMPALHKLEDHSMALAGDIVNGNQDTWSTLTTALDSGHIESFAELEGSFSLGIVDGGGKKFHLITDRRGQYPVYWSLRDGSFIASNSLAPFTWFGKRGFCRDWLWELLFFNYPISDVTPMDGVVRQLEASILSVDLNGFDTGVRIYAPLFKPADNILEGEAGLDHAVDVISEIVPEYFAGSDEAACALTGGWDGRTMLALKPNDVDVTAFTWGVPGCADIFAAEKIARKTGTKHVSLPFDSSFVSKLDAYMLRTVEFSGGQQKINRATLLYAYGRLTENGSRYPLVMSGIAFDMLFRGHAHIPALIPFDLAEMFSGVRDDFSREVWKETLDGSYSEFSKRIDFNLNQFSRKYGAFTDPAHHLLYIIYSLSTNHFAGELVINNHFSSLRVPSWDSRMIELAFSIRNGTLGFSQFLKGHTRGAIEEVWLQARILEKSGSQLGRMPVGTCHPGLVASGSSLLGPARYWYALSRRIERFGNRPAPLENWADWLAPGKSHLLNGLLFSQDTRLLDIVPSGLLTKEALSANPGLMSKLATAEIVIRLIELGWQLPEDDDQALEAILHSK